LSIITIVEDETKNNLSNSRSGQNSPPKAAAAVADRRVRFGRRIQPIDATPF
jgi:hypothetical protein